MGTSRFEEPTYLQQLRWRSRRGLLELELLLLPFAQQRLTELASPSSSTIMSRLLGCEDLDIYDWLQQQIGADGCLTPELSLIWCVITSCNRTVGNPE